MLRLIARGYAYKEVAKELFISIKTVETHVSSVLRKLAALQPPPADPLGHRPTARLAALNCSAPLRADRARNPPTSSSFAD